MSQINRRQLLQSGLALPVLSSLPTWMPTTSFAAEGDTEKKPGAPELKEKDSFTIAVLPDTQVYCQAHPEGFMAQTKWLVENKEARNIAAVLHLGDITNRNTPEQWDVAVKAMSQLDGHLPYFMVPGNHDYSAGGSAKDRTTNLNEYFPLAKFKDQPTFGGTYDKEADRMENTYHLFSSGGRDFVVIGLEFGPRADVVRWANEIAEKYSDREAILITHAYIYFDETRYDWKKYGAKQHWNPHSYGVAKATGDDVMDGEELWNNLVSKHENFIFTLNGHVLNDGLGRVTSTTPGGRDVHQMLVNFQMKPNGGDGWMRLIEFTSDNKVHIADYSPTLDLTNTSSQNQFMLDLAKIG